MPRSFAKKFFWMCVILLVVGMVLGVVLPPLLRLDPMRTAVFVSDSPDGTHRLAVFEKTTPSGAVRYEAAIFTKPHRELPGARLAWEQAKFLAGNFSAVWGDGKVELRYTDSYNNNVVIPATFSDTQHWPAFTPASAPSRN